MYLYLPPLPLLRRQCTAPFIGPESDHWLTDYSDCRLVNLIDVTLACEDDNSKLVEVITVVDVDDEDRVVADLDA